MLQNVSLIPYFTISQNVSFHCFPISTFRETYRFTCFTKNGNAKQIKCINVSRNNCPFLHILLFAKQKLTCFVSPENIKIGCMRLLQTQINNIKNICLVGNPVCINNEQRGVSPSLGRLCVCIDHLFPYHVTSVCVKADPPAHSSRHGRLFKLSSEPSFVRSQNRCHMDL